MNPLGRDPSDQISKNGDPITMACCGYSEYCSGTMAFALFIIACVATGGAMSSVGAGGAIIGLSIPMLIQNVAKAMLAPNKGATRAEMLRAIISLVGIIVGSLAIAGTMSVVAAGGTVLGLSFAYYIAGYVSECKYENGVISGLARAGLRQACRG